MDTVAYQLKKWLGEPVESLFIQVPRAVAASLLAAAVDCAVLFFLVEYAGWDRISAAILGYLAGGAVQYVLCSYWVFSGTPQNAATGFLTFTLLSLFGLVITWATMSILARAHLSLAKFVALGLAFSWNFLSRKYLLFRHTPHQA